MAFSTESIQAIAYQLQQTDPSRLRSLRGALADHPPSDLAQAVTSNSDRFHPYSGSADPGHMDDHTAGAGFAESLDFGALLADDHYAPLNGFTAANSGIESATVSPQDLFLDHDRTAPNSTALTNLTTPSLYDTPNLDSYEVSPVFGGSLNLDNNADTWQPLFDQHDAFGSSTLYDNSEPPSLTSSTSSLQHSALESVRTQSTASNFSKGDILHRLAVAAGITKSSRRATRELSPIEVEGEDDTAVKRARNTMAARKSRQKKRDVEDALRIALDAMTAERDHWKFVAIKYGAPLPPAP